MSTIQNQISSLIFNLDFLSGSKKFTMFGREKNVSLLGLVFTLIIAMMVIIYSFHEIINYFKHTNYSIISMEDNSYKITATKYIGNDTIALLRIVKYEYDEKGNQIAKEIPDLLKIFKIKAIQCDYQTETSETRYIYYNMTKCTNYFSDEDLIKYELPKDYIEQSLCPPYNAGLKLKLTRDEISSLIFKVFLCNKTEDSNCYSKEEIKEKYESGELDNIDFGFIQEYNMIDNDNNSNPITSESLITEERIDLTSRKICESQSKFIYYKSDNGIIFSSIKNYTGLRYDTYSRNTKNREKIFDYETPLLDLYYSLNTNYILNYKRTYVKFTTVIVDITGVARTLFSIGGYCIYFISKNYFSFMLFDEIFNHIYRAKNQNKINSNIRINDDINPQNSLKKDKLKEDKIKVYNLTEDSNKISSENFYLKIKAKRRNDIKTKIEKNSMTNTNIIMNEPDSCSINNKEINKDSDIIKKIDDETYSMILSKYLGFGLKNKKNLTFLRFVCFKFNKKSNNAKIISNCANIINNYLSLEQIINNGINIDLLLNNNESQEYNNIDVLNKIINDDFKNTLKAIKMEKK